MEIANARRCRPRLRSRQARDRRRLTPVFFGSASNNFGVQLLLDGFLDLAPPPAPRMAADGRVIEPTDEASPASSSKSRPTWIPRHRDRMSFIRIVSPASFERDMQAAHPHRQAVRLANSQKLFAQDRETVNEPTPVMSSASSAITASASATLSSTDPKLKFDEIPRFAPEVFAYLHNPSTAHYQTLPRWPGAAPQRRRRAAVHAQPHAGQRVPLLGAVGPLQFEVVQYRRRMPSLKILRTQAAVAFERLFRAFGEGLVHPVAGRGLLRAEKTHALHLELVPMSVLRSTPLVMMLRRKAEGGTPMTPNCSQRRSYCSCSKKVIWPL
jgi:peptide subunit release factor RF-3